MTDPSHAKLGELLVQSGLIDKMQLRAALGHQRRWGGRLGGALVNLGFISESDLIKFLSESLNYSAVDLSRSKIAPKTFDALPRKLAEKYQVIPIVVRNTPGKKTMVLAMGDPTDLALITEIEFATNYRIEPVVALESSIATVLKHYGESPSELPPDDVLSLSDEVAATDGNAGLPMQVMRDNMDQVEEARRGPSPRRTPRPPRPSPPPPAAPETLTLGTLGTLGTSGTLGDADSDKLEFDGFEEPPASLPGQTQPPTTSIPADNALAQRVTGLTKRVDHLYTLLLRLSRGELTMAQLEDELADLDS